MQRVTGAPIELRTLLTPTDVQTLQRRTDTLYVDPRVVAYAATLVHATRKPTEHNLPQLAQIIQFGASPRASINLVAGARALALIRGRAYALPKDIADLAPEVLRHRLVLTYESLASGMTSESAIDSILKRHPAPRLELGDMHAA